ncbi:MAG: hypothetical protein Q7T20_17070 [Saprospiraceae bacterium]|nr:hypothetical protein [Saprospiraceae bacterium]
MRKEKVLQAVSNLPDEFTLDELVERLIRGHRTIYANIDYERIDIFGVRHSSIPLTTIPGESST